jgi:hypothetical protein
MSESEQYRVYCIHCGSSTVVTDDTMCYVLYGEWYVKCRCGLLLNLNGG